MSNTRMKSSLEKLVLQKKLPEKGKKNIHFFVCADKREKCCSLKEMKEAIDTIKELKKEFKGQAQIQCTKCQCIGICQKGPLGIVYPEGLWLQKLNKKSIKKVIKTLL